VLPFKSRLKRISILLIVWYVVMANIVEADKRHFTALENAQALSLEISRLIDN